MNLLRAIQRPLMLGAAVVFVVFGGLALILRQFDVSENTLSVIAGVSAYLFLAYAVVLVILAWRRRGIDPAVEAVAFVRAQSQVTDLVGTPATVEKPEGDVPRGTDALQANFDVVVSGPDGIARVDLVMARIDRRWEVLTATLVSEGQRVLLRTDRAGGGAPAGDAED